MTRWLISSIKHALPDRFKRKVKQALSFQDMETRMRNLQRAGFECTGAIDAGAYAGDWAVLANAIFQCPVILVEPQPQQQVALSVLARGRPFRVENVALGAVKGELGFQLQETNSRLAGDADRGNGLPNVMVTVDRLDALLSRHADITPNLLKVDVQGFELSVLEGAGDALGQFEVVILEVSLLRIGPVPLFHEVIDFMGARGFRLYDFLPMYYRPLDGALYQGDAFFVKNESTLVARNDWE